MKTFLYWLKQSGTYFIFNFPPGQLTNHEFNQHVEEGPQVVMTAHFLRWRYTRMSCFNIKTNMSTKRDIFSPCSPYFYEHWLKHIAQFLWNLPQDEAEREFRFGKTENNCKDEETETQITQCLSITPSCPILRYLWILFRRLILFGMVTDITWEPIRPDRSHVKVVRVT